MADVPLNHLSRPQLVHLLLRIVDLLSLPSMPAQSAPSSGSQPCCPVVVPYDASIDPWNAPDESQGDPIATRDQGLPVGTGPINHRVRFARPQRPTTPAPLLPHFRNPSIYSIQSYDQHFHVSPPSITHLLTTTGSGLPGHKDPPLLFSCYSLQVCFSDFMASPPLLSYLLRLLYSIRNLGLS